MGRAGGWWHVVWAAHNTREGLKWAIGNDSWIDGRGVGADYVKVAMMYMWSKSELLELKYIHKKPKWYYKSECRYVIVFLPSFMSIMENVMMIVFSSFGGWMFSIFARRSRFVCLWKALNGRNLINHAINMSKLVSSHVPWFSYSRGHPSSGHPSHETLTT